MQVHLDGPRSWRLRAAAQRVLVRELALHPEAVAPLVVSPRRVVLAAVDAHGRRHIAKSAFGLHLSREHALHRWAASQGVPVPRLVHFTSGQPQVMVTDRITGPSLEEAGSEVAWRATGRLVRRFHDLPSDAPVHLPRGPRCWGEEVGAEAARALRRGLLTPAVVREVNVAVEQAASRTGGPEPVAVLHGDCMPKHILFDLEGMPHLIDLEWCRLDDPAWDLAVLTTFHPDRLTDLLDGYDPPPAERCRLEAAVVARQLERLVRAVTWNAANGFDDAVERCRRALIERLEAG